MTAWEEFVPVVATASGVVAAGAQLLSVYRAEVRRQKDVRRLDEHIQETAIDSSDIEVVGGYLYEKIGAIRVSDVVSNTDVRNRTMNALARLTQFIGEDPEPIPREQNVDAGAAQVLPIGELTKARDQILAGEIWNGLAAMRRHIELTLRARMPDLQNARIDAGRLVDEGRRSETIPADAAPPLRFAINVANRAIHGEPVDISEALQAIDAGNLGLQRIL